MNRILDLLRRGKPEAAAERRRITLGGREYESIGESTMEHDALFWALTDELRIYKDPNESSDDFSRRLLAEAMCEGKFFTLLGYVIVPAGVPGEAWTPDLAGQTAAHLRTVSAPEEKLEIRNMLMSMLLDFFESGRISIETSPTSSRIRPPNPSTN